LLDQSIRTGLAGAGVFGELHAQKLAAHDDARFVSVFDTDFTRAQSLADRFGATAYQDYASFLESVDAVTVASPAASHFELALSALLANRHVYVEKPITLLVSHADKLISLANEKGLALQVGHQERFVLEAFGVLSRPTIPNRISFTRCGPRSGRCEEVSVVFDLMIHDLDLARQFGLGDPVSSRAVGDHNRVEATLSFSGNRIAEFEASRCAQERNRKLVVDYDDGVVEIDFIARKIANSLPNAIVDCALDDAFSSAALSDPLGLSVSQFISAALGKNPPAISGADGREALRWAQMIDEAASEDRRASLSATRAIA